MKTILLTGFEPFGGDLSNPSQRAAEALDGLKLPGCRVTALLLPVDTGRAPEVLDAALDRLNPQAVLLPGLASGRSQLSLERVALNVLDFRLPDNAGQTRQDCPVSETGPDALLSTLPLRAVLAAWRDAGIPGYISDTAGLYLCNQLMYHARQRLGPDIPAGFLHLPACEALALESKAHLPYLPQAELTRGVQVALETLATSL